MKVPVNESLAIEVATVVEAQVAQLAATTPNQFIKRREGRGGKMLDYVTANYITARLNSAFRFNWDFEIMEQIISTKAKSIATRGRLTVRFADGQVVKKEQWGSAGIKVYSGTVDAVDISDDMKSSASDALKKCASLLGIAWDVYGGYSKTGMPNGEPKTQKEKEQEAEPEAVENMAEEGVYPDEEDKEESDSKKTSFERDPREDEEDLKDAVHAEEEKKTSPDMPEPKDREEHYKTINIPWIDGRNYFVSKFEVLDLFGKMKKALGQKFYYEILGQAGFEKSDQIPKDKAPTVMKTMVDAYLGK